MKAKWQLLASAVALMLAVPTALTAQVDDAWTVDLYGGALIYAEASALEPMPSAGIEALYHLTPRIAIGPMVEFGYTQTDSRYFVGVYFFGADSSRVMQVGQNVSVMHFGGTISFDILPDSRLGAYALAGGGIYGVYLDVQSNEGVNRMTGPMAFGGLGISFDITENAGIHLDARDMYYMDFDRGQLNPIPESERNVKEDGTVLLSGYESDLPGPSSELHNLRFSVGFSYIPQTN